jgi:hypothetical protein
VPLVDVSADGLAGTGGISQIKTRDGKRSAAPVIVRLLLRRARAQYDSSMPASKRHKPQSAGLRTLKKSRSHVSRREVGGRHSDPRDTLQAAALRRAWRRQRQIEQQRPVARLVERSPAVRRISENAEALRLHLRLRKRKIWPLATVAKLFGVSPSLLRKWIDCGVLSRSRLPKPYRPGITEQSIRRLLRQLAGDSDWISELDTKRQRPAERKCGETCRQLGRRELLTSNEFAELAGVSMTTVHRMVESKIIRSHRPTPGRIMICHWDSRIVKKRI